VKNQFAKWLLSVLFYRNQQHRRPILPKPATSQSNSDNQDYQEKLAFFDLVSLMRSSICEKSDFLEVNEISTKMQRKEMQKLKDEVVKQLQGENILVSILVNQAVKIRKR